jgi:hypothetical protein
MLNDTRVRTTKPCQRPIKLSDSGGLYLLIAPHGSKLWRLAYRFGGKQKTLAIGAYPTFTLKAARDKREEAKRLLANGIDPSMQRRLDKQITSTGNTFKAVAEEVLAKRLPDGSGRRGAGSRDGERELVQIPYLASPHQCANSGVT